MNSKSIRDTGRWLMSYVPTSSYTHSKLIQSSRNAPYSLTCLPTEDMDSDASSEEVQNGFSKVDVTNGSQKCKKVRRFRNASSEMRAGTRFGTAVGQEEYLEEKRKTIIFLLSPVQASLQG